MRSIRQWPPSVAGCFASGCECRLRDNPCCSCGRGEADGEEQWAGPMQRAAVTDTTTEAPKNAWSQARAMDLTPPPPPHPNPTLLMSHGAPGPRGQDLQRRAANHTEGAAEPGVCAVDWPERGDYRGDSERGQPHPKLSDFWHGYGEHLRAEHLRAREEKEEPWPHGSD